MNSPAKPPLDPRARKTIIILYILIAVGILLPPALFFLFGWR